MPAAVRVRGDISQPSVSNASDSRASHDATRGTRRPGSRGRTTRWAAVMAAPPSKPATAPRLATRANEGFWDDDMLALLSGWGTRIVQAVCEPAVRL